MGRASLAAVTGRFSEAGGGQETFMSNDLPRYDSVVIAQYRRLLGCESDQEASRVMWLMERWCELARANGLLDEYTPLTATGARIQAEYQEWLKQLG